MSRTAQTQTARPVARAAATRRTAVAPSKTAFSSRFAAKGQTIFCIDAESRPRYGQALFTHTVAALQALGMLRPGQPAVSKAIAQLEERLQARLLFIHQLHQI